MTSRPAKSSEASVIPAAEESTRSMLYAYVAATANMVLDASSKLSDIADLLEDARQICREGHYRLERAKEGAQ